MKKLFLFCVSNFFYLEGFNQLKEISTKEIYKLEINSKRCLDSNNKKTYGCQLWLLNVKIDFYKAYLDKSNKKIRLIGRTYMSSIRGDGMGGFAISTAKTNGLKLSEKKFLVESTIVEGTTNNGFFDVTFFIEEKMSVFFENDAFFLKEFVISQLIKNH